MAQFVARSSGSSADDIPDWLRAKEGLQLLINNHKEDAMALFQQYNNKLPIFSGYSFAVFMEALMTLEDDKLASAISVLKEVERRCSLTSSDWVRSVRSRMFRGGNSSPASINMNSPPSPVVSALEHTLETQIILADSLVCLAILTFLQQDISGYLRGGWILRKAWKIYQAVYTDIWNLYRRTVGSTAGVLPDPSMRTGSMDSLPQTPQQAATHSLTALATSASYVSLNLRKSMSVSSALAQQGSRFSIEPDLTSPSDPQIISQSNVQTIDKATIERLMGAVSFGYGLFQMGVSLLPPSLLRLTSFLGLGGGNRSNGLLCLAFARASVDMRAPLATLSLLWYHTIVRPFYAIDGINVQAGVQTAQKLLLEEQRDYGEAGLFLFFSGRTHRLNSDIDAALQSFERCVAVSQQRELRVLSLHEVGWCHLIRLDYEGAERTFGELRQTSRWSGAFYTYVATICAGCRRRSVNVADVLQHQHRPNQLDEFLRRRAHLAVLRTDSNTPLNILIWKMLVYEMLYLWNALPSCHPDNVKQIIEDCQQMTIENITEPMLGLCSLILGCCYNIKGDREAELQSFHTCLETRQRLSPHCSDAHISAFAQFELGNSLITRSTTREEGRHLLQEMSKYKGYDFEERLNVRVHNILRQY